MMRPLQLLFQAVLVAVSTAAAGYLFDIRPLLQRYVELDAEAKNVRSQLEISSRKMQRTLDHSSMEIVPAEHHFEDFSRQVFASQLEMNEVTKTDVNSDDYRVVLRGEYASLVRLLAREHALFDIKNIVITPEYSEYVRAEMQISLTGADSADTQSADNIANPFCGADMHRLPQSLQQSAHDLGIVIHDGRRIRLEMDADGRMREVGLK